MAFMRVWQRLVALAVVAAFMVALTPAPASAARFEIKGTVHSKNEANETMVIITSDVIGQPQAITVDMGRFSRVFRDTAVNSSIAMVIEDRPFDTFKVVGLTSFGSYVNQNDFGTQEHFNPRNDSIQAHVQNVPDDDEALAKQNRGSNLKKDDDDDK